MTQSSRQQIALPRELMVMQLDQIDLLMAMYALDDAIAVDADSRQTLDVLKAWCDQNDGQPPSQTSSSIDMVLSLDSPDSLEMSSPESSWLQLSLSVPLTCGGELPLDFPPAIKARLQQPPWMSKAQVAGINSSIPQEDILTVIEHVKHVAFAYAQAENHVTATTRELFDAHSPITRVWFYFPSISTRAKRDDLVQNAPHYGLTGFLLAGKPGILCLEGGSVAIDDFMKYIKTESWGDIPSQHKKVSERRRETGVGLLRTFADMQEITETVGERRGERGNRSDMKALELWLAERGLSDILNKVLM